MEAMITIGLDRLPKSLVMLHVFTVFAAIALIFLYGLHLYKNRRLSGNTKMRWLIGFIFGSFIIMPLYWWKYIWRRN